MDSETALNIISFSYSPPFVGYPYPKNDSGVKPQHYRITDYR